MKASGWAREIPAAMCAAAMLTVAVAAVPAQEQTQQQTQPQAQPAAAAQQDQQGQQSQPAPQKATAVPVKPPQEEQQRQAATPTKRQALIQSSDLVRVDVEVTDKSGKPVKGLKQEQFTISDNGKSQKISIFNYSDIESVETAPKTDAAPTVVSVDSPTPVPQETLDNAIKNRRLLVLFFDLSSMQTDDLLRAHDAALKFVQKQMSNADLVSVIVYSTKLSVWADFTDDKKKLEKAISNLTPEAASQMADNLSAAAQEGEYDVQEYTGAAYTADETEFNVFNTDEKLAAIEGLANVLGAIPGRKSMIEFTGGITQTGEENRTELRAATDAANLADVSIYSIDARGLFATPPGGDATVNASTGNSMYSGASVFHQTDARMDSRDTLSTLASDTGGRAFYDLGDLSDAFPAIQKDNAGYYLLGYYLTSDVKRDGRWRAIHVKVNVPGAHVRYRTGYYAPRDFQHLEQEGRQQQLAEAMSTEDPIVELPIAVETAQFRLSDQQVYVPIDAKLSSSALDWAEKHGKRQAEFDFAAEVRDDRSDRVVADLQDTITVSLDTERYQQVHQANLVYQGGIVVAPGNYRLKFLARENESGKIGTFEEALDVPASQPDRLTMSSVLLSSQLVAVEKTAEVQTKAQGARAKMTSSPLEMAGEKIVPSVTRYFNTQQTLYVFFQAYFPEKGEKGGAFDPGTLRAGLIFFRDGVQANATPMLAPAQVDEKSHTASFRVSLPLSKLAAGRYAVQALVIAPGTQHSAFGRAYLALEQPAPVPATAPGQQPGAPTGAKSPTR
jgi:VWFA-related protein